MNKPKVVITDYYYESIHQEAAVMAEIGAELRDYHCQTEDEVIAAAAGCDALICQFAPITRKVIESLDKCKVIVRYAIGVDNIDVAAAEERGIYVCNVPDYETHPVHRAFRRCHAVSGSLLVGHIQQLRQQRLRFRRGRLLGRTARHHQAGLGGDRRTFRHALSEAAYTFKEQVEALSNGSITVDLYPAAQLGDATSMLTQVEAGTLEACMSVSNGQFATSYYPDLGFLDIPFLFESSQEAYDLLNPEGEFFLDLQSDISEKTGIRPLVFFNEGLRHITNSKHEIRTPEDMKGLKIRTMNVTAHMKMFEALGAQPTNVSWNELYTALQTGLADGQENPIANAVYISAWEVQKYMTLDGHVCLCGLFCMNEDFYQSLSQAQKDAVDQAALKALEAEYSMYQSNEAANLELLKENGLQVTELTSEEIDAFRQACQPQVLEYLRSTMDTPELLDKAMQAVEDARG